MRTPDELYEIFQSVDEQLLHKLREKCGAHVDFSMCVRGADGSPVQFSEDRQAFICLRDINIVPMPQVEVAAGDLAADEVQLILAMFQVKDYGLLTQDSAPLILANEAQAPAQSPKTDDDTPAGPKEDGSPANQVEGTTESVAVESPATNKPVVTNEEGGENRSVVESDTTTKDVTADALKPEAATEQSDVVNATTETEITNPKKEEPTETTTEST